MAHITDCLISEMANSGPNNKIPRESSPSPHLQDENIKHYQARKGSTGQIEAKSTPTSNTRPNEKEKHVWRLHQPSEPRRYQLFPAKDKIPNSGRSKSPDQENGLALALEGLIDRSLSRKRSKDNVRRRKVSIPELGTMITVEEVTMDSPTIPGRPAFHERSISAPGSQWRTNMFGEAMLSCVAGPTLDERDERAEMKVPETPWPESGKSTAKTPNLSLLKSPISPKNLAPLVIPEVTAPPPQRIIVKQLSANKLRNAKEGAPDVPPKSARMLNGRASPHQRNLSSTNISNNTTPLEGRNSPVPWCNSNNNSPSRDRQASDPTSSQPQRLGHRRGESDTSVMDRGRPKRRADGKAIKSQPKQRDASAEQKAFVTLPTGVRAINVTSKYGTSDSEKLHKQALGQAAKFEVLGVKDVDSLSRELRALDERCEYLRKTHRSLRSDRRNLHQRICVYLRSARVARFTHESLLKQEEALAELDCSIDDWVSKIEQAENRRTRIRQKLLEHVAAAVSINTFTPPSKMAGQHTPPRSPTKSHSPQRLAATVPAPSPDSEMEHSRSNVESIRIYADSDIYALLADVENEINRMGEGIDNTPISATDSAICLVEQPLNVSKIDAERSHRKASVEDITKAVEEEEFTLKAVCFQPPAATVTA